MKWKIPLFKMYSDEEDVKAVSEVVKRSMFWAAGPEIDEFEKELAKYCEKGYAVTFNSGTSASHAMLLAHGVVSGEVICPSFTFISAANCALMTGAKPVFTDIEEETYGLDVESVKSKFGQNTKAVMLVHYAGCPARDTEEIRDFCKDKNILLFEDNAESMGAAIDGKKTGTFGDAAMLSFCQSKIITTGEGGAVVTDSRDIYEKLKLIRSHGRLDKEEDYFNSIGQENYVELGYNFRMPSMNAALGLSQLRKIDFLINSRQKIAGSYDLEGMHKAPNGFTHVYQLFTIRLESEEIRDGLRDYLAKNGIMTKVYFNSAHLMDFYKDSSHLPVTEQVSKTVLSLPIYVGMDEELKEVKVSIKKYFEG